MKKTKKRLMRLLIPAALLCFTLGMTSFAAAAEKGGSSEGDKGGGGASALPSAADEFLLGSWISFYDTDILSYEEQLADMARSGLNYQPNTGVTSGCTTPKDRYVKFTLEEYNGMYKRHNSYFSVYPGVDTNAWAPISTAEEARLWMDRAKDLSNCISYSVKDEPSAAQFEELAGIFKELKKDGSRFAWAGLYPNYAGSAALGGSYSDYVKKWVNAVGPENLEYLSYDHYPFTGFETVRSSYFSDLETIRRTAYDNGRIKTMACTQLGSWNSMRRPTADEARWNVNSYLAYGVKGLIHFNWVAPKYVAPADGGEGMEPFVLTSGGEKTDLYEPMQKINWKTRQLGPLLMNMDVAHAYHSGKVADGAEALPKHFIFRPQSLSDNLIFSLCYGKNGKDIYLMLFNNETAGDRKEYRVKVDLNSGVKSLTKYITDDFDVLPDYMRALPALGEETVDISDGSFTESMLPGELAVYRLNGDVVIKEALKAPETDLPDGTYTGKQRVGLTSPEKDAEIYYTLDGSFPDPKVSEKCENGYVEFGRTGENRHYVLRAVSVRDGEISKASLSEYFISDMSRNVAAGRPVKFYDKAFEHEVTAKTERAETDGHEITDGAHDPFNEVILEDNGWAVVDLGEPYLVDRIITSFWNNWDFKNVVMQVSLSSGFEDCTTVYNSNRGGADYDGSLPAGDSPDWKDDFGKGKTVAFSPVEARYVRIYNVGMGAGVLRGQSIWQEIEVFCHLENEGRDLTATAPEDWKPCGGGTWTKTADKISASSESSASWDRSYVYTKETFKNFIIEATFAVTEAKGSFVGFGLYKNNPRLPVAPDNGYYVLVENGGRVATYNNATEFGPRNITVPGFNVNSPFTLRVVSTGGFLSVSVNGKSVYTIRDGRCDLESGYISLLAATNTVEISGLKITEIEDDIVMEEAAYEQKDEIKIAVPEYTNKKEVKNLLPGLLAFTDTKGGEITLAVNRWKCYDYNSARSGYYAFEGEIAGKNPYWVIPKVRVFVRNRLDYSDLQRFLDKAKSLKPGDYTEESMNEVRTYMDLAEDVMKDKFLAQSDIGVAVMRLAGALDGLKNTVTDKSLLIDRIERFKNTDLKRYLPYTSKIFSKALSYAKEVAASKTAGQAETDNAGRKLENAYNGLIEKGDKSELTGYIERAEAKLTKDISAVKRLRIESKIQTARAVLKSKNVSAAVISAAVNDLKKVL